MGTDPIQVLFWFIVSIFFAILILPKQQNGENNEVLRNNQVFGYRSLFVDGPGSGVRMGGRVTDTV
jgi:hypothetical protein